mmetsp:Transcript_11739/g.16981  ORF Transcript_11739/g.16981 Transcript_11739/m.16981 type:complete len:84 (-) Transcript_11739:228-479(-)
MRMVDLDFIDTLKRGRCCPRVKLGPLLVMQLMMGILHLPELGKVAVISDRSSLGCESGEGRSDGYCRKVPNPRLRTLILYRHV